MNKKASDQAKGMWLMLSGREREIVDCARQGLIDKEIAKKLDIGMGTIRTYWERIRTKTGARGRAELVSIIDREELEVAIAQGRHTKDVLASIIDNSWFGLALYSEEACEVLHANKMFQQICKILSGFLLSGTPLPSKDGDLTAACIRQLLLPQNMLTHSTIGPKDARYRLSTAKFVINGAPVVLLQLDDLSQLETIEPAADQKSLTDLFGSVRVPLLATTRHGYILFTTRAAQKLLERSSRDLVARKFQDLMIPVDESDWYRLLMERGSVEFQVRYTPPTNMHSDRHLLARISNQLNDRSIRAITILLSRLQPVAEQNQELQSLRAS